MAVSFPPIAQRLPPLSHGGNFRNTRNWPANIFGQNRHKLAGRVEGGNLGIFPVPFPLPPLLESAVRCGPAALLGRELHKGSC